MTERRPDSRHGLNALKVAVKVRGLQQDLGGEAEVPASLDSPGSPHGEGAVPSEIARPRGAQEPPA